MIRPTPRLALACLALAGAAALATFAGVQVVVALAGLCLLTGLSALDLWLLSQRPAAVVVRPTQLTGSLRRELSVPLEVFGRGATAVAPAWPRALGGPIGELPLAPGAGAARLSFSVVPRRRGVFDAGAVWVRRESPGRLWARREVLDPPCRVSVLPDLLGPADDALGRELELEGERAAIGAFTAGGELRALRPFQGGDDPRHVDWKATARLGSPVVREWQPDRRRSVIVVLDAGRLMRAEHDGETKLDASLRALLRLALSAEAHGDRVGALVFAERPLRQVPPLHGSGQAGRLLRFLGDLEARNVESDLARAVPLLLAETRRSLVIIVTDVVDQGGARALVAPVVQLLRQHVPIVALLRDPHLDQALSADVSGADDAYRRAAAELVARDRHMALEALRARGVRALDLSMRSLALEVVQAYVDTRRRARMQA